LKNLKAVVQNKTLNDVALDAAARPVGCLYQEIIDTFLLQPAGAAEACKARSDNNCVESL
jgi:hypothetical protein